MKLYYSTFNSTEWVDGGKLYRIGSEVYKNQYFDMRTKYNKRIDEFKVIVDELIVKITSNGTFSLVVVELPDDE